MLKTFGPAVLAFAGGIAGVLLSIWTRGSVEHEQWLRSQRQSAYLAVLSASDACAAALIDYPAEGTTETFRAAALGAWLATTHVELVGDIETARAAARLALYWQRCVPSVTTDGGMTSQEALDGALEFYNAVLTAARRDLGVKGVLYTPTVLAELGLDGAHS